MKSKIIYADLSYELTGILFAVHNDLGRFCNEKQVCDRIEYYLKKRNYKYEREKVLEPSFDGERKGRNRVDFLVEDKIVLEIKVKRILGKEDFNQVMRYLESLNMKLAILANYKSQYLAPKRILNPNAKE
ncbi:GxxExxY protein [Candidatus Kuenenbacteria bacterium]|nr:GxxExxY protein [Candidatus Kuenenbacteria bacterium]